MDRRCRYCHGSLILQMEREELSVVCLSCGRLHWSGLDARERREALAARRLLSEGIQLALELA